MTAPLMAIITGVGDVNPVAVDMNGLSWSRGISLNGTCSAEFPTRSLVTAGLLLSPTALDDQWFSHTHPALGEWAGEVQSVRHTGDTGTTEVAAQDWSSLLESRRAAIAYSVSPAASAGDILTRLITDAGRQEGPMFIESVLSDSDGWPVEVNLRSDDISDAFRQIVTASGMEYRFNPDRTVEIRRQFGQDLTDSIQLVWGRDIVAYDYLSARRSVVNDLLAIPSDARFAATGSFIVEDTDSIEAGRRRQGVKTYPNFVSQNAMRPLALADLERMVLQGQTPTIDVCNLNSVFGQFESGDIVRVVIEPINAAFDMRILVESWDSDSDLLKLSGVVTGV